MNFAYAMAPKFFSKTKSINYDLYFVHSDHLGTPVKVTNESIPAQVVWEMRFKPFGEVAYIDEDVDGDSEDFILNFRYLG